MKKRKKHDALGSDREAYQYTGDDWKEYVKQKSQQKRHNQNEPNFYGKEATEEQFSNFFEFFLMGSPQ